MQLHRSGLWDWYRWRESDEFTFVDWSHHLAAGNWLDVPPYRASFSWMAASGTPEEWERRYLPNGYFQGPLYAYLLATVRATLGHVITSARLLQALVAAFVAGLVAAAVRAAAARRGSALAGDAGAFVSGIAYGLYAPSVFHDGFLYRDGLLSHGSTALIVLPLLASGFGAVALFAIGLGAGLLTLLKQTALPVGLAALVLAVWRARGSRRKGTLVAAAGFVLPLAALAARNVAAGVPPLLFDTRQAFTFVWAHGRGAEAMHIPPPETFRLLDRTGPSVSKTAVAVWKSWSGDRAALARLEGTKALSFFQAYEAPDNASFDFFRGHIPLLRGLPVFALLLGPGLVGLFVAWRANVLPRGEALVLAIGFLVPLASQVVALENSRYRLPVIGALAVGAGLGVALLLDGARRHPRRAVAAGVAAALLSAVTFTPPVIPHPRHRWADAIVLASILDGRGERDAARAEVRRYLAEGTDDIDRERGVTQLGMWMDGTRGDAVLAPPEK